MYLLHFSGPYKHAKHYLGWAVDPVPRAVDHWNGRGARLVRIVRDAGLTFMIARTWPGVTKQFERDKKVRGLSRLCPVCAGKLAYAPFDPAQGIAAADEIPL